MIELVRQAQETKSKTQDLANKAAFVLTIVALAVGTITLFVWLAYSEEFVFAIERAKDLQAVVFDKTGTLTKGEFGDRCYTTRKC